MLTIRRQQQDSLQTAGSTQLANDLVAHLKVFAPDHARALGDDALRQIIDSGLSRARAYGFTTRGALRYFVELLFVFGSGFDTDPQYPWAVALLQAPAAGDPNWKANELFKAAEDYLFHVGGPDRAYALAALVRAEAELKGPWLSAGPDQAAGILAGFQRVYPEKCAYTGDEVLYTTINEAGRVLATYAPVSASGWMLFSALSFSFGHRFFADPLYPWIESCLAADLAPAERIDKLYSHSLTYLRAVARKRRGSRTEGDS